MSESGQTRSFGDVCSMSGLPSRAAVQRTSVDVSQVQILLQKSVASFFGR
jgi:hypothetical protein